MDQRIAEHANIVVNYCCEVRKGDFVLVMADGDARPLIREIASRIGEKEARLLVIDRDLSIDRSHLLAADKETIATLPKPLFNLVRDSDALIQIICSLNTQELSDVPPEKMSAMSKARGPLLSVIEGKRWNVTLHPTPALAQDAKMSFASYSDFVYSATIRDWPKMASQMKVLSDLFSKSKRVHLTGKDTDISFSIEGRKPIIDDGKKNLPGGEVFISPVETSVNGKVYFDLPINFLGRDIKGARLVYKDGEIVESDAEEGGEYLKALLSTDPGARRLGELGIGMNRGIDRFTKNILFDEKMGDTIHMAVGLAFEESGGT
ncbi:MAG: aminopeptidase, partial [Nitrososphaerales archaeon]